MEKRKRGYQKNGWDLCLGSLVIIFGQLDQEDEAFRIYFGAAQ